MLESPPCIELRGSSPDKELPVIRNDELNALGEKWMQHEDDSVESDEPEIIIDTICNPLVQDDSSNESSVRAIRLTRCTENNDEQQECNGETNNFSKPTEFVIVSTTSGSTIKFPDDTQVKDELAEPIATSCPLHDDEALENDPMGLLEYNDRSDANSIRSNGDQDDGAADDISSSYSSSVQTNSSVVNISDWSKNYPWLLHEESDEWYGYCLYCDVKLSVRSIKTARVHGMSHNHKERCENYLAFCEEEARNNLSTSVAEIKHEFGTDSYIAALKLKRKSQAEAFNNYNWRRWLDQCPWLERDNVAGTIGFCKYCSVRVNAEFKYLRQRHQEGGNHREQAKHYKRIMDNNNCVEKSTEVNGEDTGKNDNTDNRSDGEKEEEDEPNGEDQEDQTPKYDEHWCYESVGNSSARCVLCDLTLQKRSSFKRHILSQSHVAFEKNLSLVAQVKAKKGLPHENQGDNNDLNKSSANWQSLYQLHPWLEADALDSTYAYCKYCDKRLLYGSSASKRSLHENGRSHKTNEQIYKNTAKYKQQNAVQANENERRAIDGREEDGAEDEETDNAEEAENAEDKDESESGEEEKEGSDDNDEEEEENDDQKSVDKDVEEGKEEENSEQEDKADVGVIKSKKRFAANSSAWYGEYSWCKRYRKDPNYCFCSYCKIPIIKKNRNKHSSTKRHIEIENTIMRRTKPAVKEENHFLWATTVKGHPNLYFCKYCRVRISTNYSKKQHSQCKIHLINEQLYQDRKTGASSDSEKKSFQPTPAPSSQQSSPTPALPKVVAKTPSFISSIKQWQKRHTWLGYKLSELRSNYAYCKACEQSLYVRSFKNVIKHQRSSKHLRIISQLRRERRKEAEERRKDQMDRKLTTKHEVDQNSSISALTQDQEKNEETNISSTDLLTKGNNYSVVLESMKKRYSWIMKSTLPDHAYCRYCDANVPLRDIFLRNHTNARTHRRSVVNFEREKPKTEENDNDDTNTPGNEADDNMAEGDANIVFIEDNNAEEILIAEHDDNWAIKSEMDEHEALDCLLQRALAAKNASGQRDKRKQQKPASNEIPEKRFKRSHSFRRQNDSAANSSMLSSILSTPLTLASCLGPLIQQQIQQATNTSASAASAAATAASAIIQPPPVQHKEAENTFDLFFKSVSETMKKLPIDIAAEGKLKVMQIICDLELKALKRKHDPQYPVARDDSTEQTNYSNFSTASSVINTTSSHAAENLSINGNNTSPIVTTNNLPSGTAYDYSSSDHRVEAHDYTSRTVNENNNLASSGSDQHMGNALSAPSYRQVNTSNSNYRQPTLAQQEVQQKLQQASTVASVANSLYTSSQTSGNNTTVDKNRNQQQAPLIGVMDMNGLQTLQLRNTQNPAVNQTANHNTANNNNQTTGATTSIRCIPFKNLSQNNSSDSNTKYARIQIPMSAASTPTSTSSQKTSPNMTSTPKSLLNLRSIHITKRTGTPQQHQHQQQQHQLHQQHPHQSSSLASVSVVNTNSTDKNQPTTSYVQASNVQRWAPVNGSINNVANKKPQPNQYTSPVGTYQINRNYK